MLRRIGASLLTFACLGAIAAACNTTRGAELEPRYVAVHNTLAALGMAQVGAIQQGSLAEGRESRLRVDLGAQCSTVVAIGGPGVRDLDVALLDPDDKLVAEDTTKEPEATVRTCPSSPGHYTLVVRMRAGAGDFLASTWTGAAAPPSSSGAAQVVLGGPGSGTCEAPFPLVPGATTGNTRHGEAENTGGCANAESKEIVYKLEITKRQRVTIEVDPQFDSVLYIRKQDCSDAESEIACNDDATSAAGKRGPSSRGSRLAEVLDPGTYYVFVDGYGAESGSFRMDVDIADVPSIADACKQLPTLGTAKISGSLSSGFDHGHASCGGGAKGPDVLHRFDLGARARVRITEHSADFVPALHVRKVCTDEHSEIACADSGVKADEATWAGLLDAGSYTLFADSSDKDARGHYTLESELAPEGGGTGVRGDTCADATPLSLNEKGIEGDTFLAHDDIAGKCGGQGAPDVLYRFELARRSRIMAQFPTQEQNHVFVLTRSCAYRSSELACGPFLDEMLDPGVYFLGVDGATADELGRFTFNFFAKDVSAQESACRAPPLLVDGQTVSGTTAGAGDRFTTSCAGREDAQASADRVYRFVLGSRARVRLLLSTPTWDGVLAIRKSCLDPAGANGARLNETACNNDFQDSRHAKIEQMLDAGTYWVVVDGHQARNEGAYTLEYRVLK